MSSLRWSARVVTSLLALSMLGCGASSTASVNTQCRMVNECGGDVIGTWKVLGGCVDPLAPGAGLGCPLSEPALIVNEGFTGTLTFNSDMTYTASIVGTGTSTYTAPTDCVPAGESCAQLNLGCTGSGPCTCPAPPPFAVRFSGSGIYSLTGNNISVTMASGAGAGTPYCVQGDLLHFTEPEPVSGYGTLITGDLVAQKQ